MSPLIDKQVFAAGISFIGGQGFNGGLTAAKIDCASRDNCIAVTTDGSVYYLFSAGGTLRSYGDTTLTQLSFR